MDNFQSQQFIVVLLNRTTEIQTGIAETLEKNNINFPKTYFQSLHIINLPFVNDFTIFPLQKGTHFGLASQNGSYQFTGNLLLNFVGISVIPFL